MATKTKIPITSEKEDTERKMAVVKRKCILSFWTILKSEGLDYLFFVSFR
jgi:hypothetical protein